VTTASVTQAWQIADLPLHKLLALGRKVAKPEPAQTIRLAILGDAATQHYNQALSAALKIRGFWPEVYEAEFDMLHHEIRDGGSALYEHRPDFILLFTVTQALWSRFAQSGDKKAFAEQTVSELAELWGEIRKRSSAVILQHNFVVPLNRPFGNSTSALSETFASAVAHINAWLATRASENGIKLVDTEFQAAYFGKRQWFDERLWCQARQALSPSFLPPLAKSITDTLLLERGVGVKCVVLDLDNTLWGGILADDGLEQIEIGQTELGLAFYRFQMAIAELGRRGVLLAACSKNDLENVFDVLDNHPDMLLRRKDFAVVVANFGDKVSNIMKIRETLNIGFESMVFLDDTPFERELVRSALPAVQVPDLPDDPASFVSELARWNIFEGRAVTAEDASRSEFYQADAERLEIRRKYEGLDDFISDLGMEANILSIDGYSLPRALQLIQRSNQFNLTTIRHSEAALKAIAESADCRSFCIRLSDRLGDNGIIAVVIVRREATDAVVDTWIMSCRVLGRKVEQLTLQRIAIEARRLGCDRIVGQYIPTSKNHMVANLYRSHGFDAIGARGDVSLFALPLERYKSEPVPIKVVEQERGHDAGLR
jgi:FkbH-like protein